MKSMGDPEYIHAIDNALAEVRKEAERVGREAGGRELSLTITKLEEALMWALKSREVR